MFIGSSPDGMLKRLQKLPNGALAFAVPGELALEEFPKRAEEFVNRIGASVGHRGEVEWLLYRDHFVYTLRYNEYPRQMTLTSVSDHGIHFFVSFRKSPGTRPD
jgi:hypothetical protein